VVVVVLQSAFHSEMYHYNFFKKLFLTLAYQNDIKIPKNINLKRRKK
jgi:hypothetical protein